MLSKIGKQSLKTEESSHSQRQRQTNQPTKKKHIAFWKPNRLSATSLKKAIGEIEKGTRSGSNEALGLPDNLEKVLASLGAGNMEELDNLSADQPPSDALVEAFKTVYEREKRLRQAGQQSILSTPTVARSQQHKHTSSTDDDEEGFQKFLSIVTDSRKFSLCLRGDPGSEPDTEFFRTLNGILHAKDIPIYAQREIMGYYHRKSLDHVLRGVPNEERHNHVVRYYAQGANLVGLQSRQLLKFLLPDGHEVRNSPYSTRPSLCPNYRPHNRALFSPKIQHVKSTKSRKTVEIEHYIRQLSVKREGVETLEMVTPVKIKVLLKVKNRAKLTYDDINQIRRKAEEGVDLYLHTLTRCKRWDALHLWASMQKLHPNLEQCGTFPETFSTYSWTWSGRRNMVEIWELVDEEGTAAPPPSPDRCALPKST